MVSRGSGKGCVGGGATMVRHPKIIVRLAGPVNDFAVVDHVTKALRMAGIPTTEIDQFCDEALASSENELLEICGQWVTLVP
jgi:hypothetical protein